MLSLGIPETVYDIGCRHLPPLQVLLLYCFFQVEEVPVANTKMGSWHSRKAVQNAQSHMSKITFTRNKIDKE